MGDYQQQQQQQPQKMSYNYDNPDDARREFSNASHSSVKLQRQRHYSDDRAPPEPRRNNNECCGYPQQVYFILGNEFCERFSYYGMHAILVIYLMSMLKMSKDDATAVYHAFNMLCYFSPIFGAIIADSCWGRYRTILNISLVYALGNVVVSLTAIPSMLNTVQLYGPALGLTLIALGTGGIKPCVSAFGGDQFDPGQEDKLQSFFSIFYFAINFGSLIATLLTPVLRADVTCFGYDCYPLAFGVPAILMILSLLLFVAGSGLYRKVPPEGNVVVQVSSAVWSAITNKMKACGSGERRNHWTEWASNKYSNVLKSDIKELFKVLFMFLPLPVFWTLFDQQGSRWTLQAMEMNGDVGWLGTIKPDQMQALNPVFVMLLIPFAETILYPIGRMCGLLTKPLQRMGAGMLFVALSFVIAGYLQMRMEAKSSVANLPPTGFANYRIINTVPCDISVFSEEFKNRNLTIPYQHGTEYFSVPTRFRRLHIDSLCAPRMTLDQDISIVAQNSYTLVIGVNHSRLVTSQLLDDVTPLGHTRSKVRFLHSGGSVTDAITIKLNKTLQINLTPFANPNYIDIISKSYHVRAAALGTSDALALKRIKFGKGGIYTVVIQPNSKLDGLKFFVYEDVSPRPISILWQIPQYIVITLGEVMFSITGLEFAYSQSPPSMKSCIMAAWLLTVSVGNLLVVILAGARLTEDMAKEFFFFAGLLGIVTLVFAIMAAFYRYVNYGYSRVMDDESETDEMAMEPDDYDEGGGGGGEARPLLIQTSRDVQREQYEEERIALPAPRSPAREEPVRREIVHYQYKEAQAEYPDRTVVPVRRIVKREDDEFAMAVEEEESVKKMSDDEFCMAVEESESEGFAMAVEESEHEFSQKSSDAFAMAVEESSGKSSEGFVMAAEDEEYCMAVEDSSSQRLTTDEEWALAAEEENISGEEVSKGIRRIKTQSKHVTEQEQSQQSHLHQSTTTTTNIKSESEVEDVEWYGSREVSLNRNRPDIDVDFPAWDFSRWKQSGHPITFGEIIGGMRFMVNDEISAEIASGMIAQTMVNHWMLRNVDTESGETVQRRLYSDYQDFLSMSVQIRRGNFSAEIMDRYQSLMTKRRTVYDIFITNETQQITRRLSEGENRYTSRVNENTFTAETDNRYASRSMEERATVDVDERYIERATVDVDERYRETGERYTRDVDDRYVTQTEERYGRETGTIRDTDERHTRDVSQDRYANVLLIQNIAKDFPLYDFNDWKNSGHLMTYGEAIGSMQFMIERKISAEVASGIMARTWVTYWNERNVNTQGEERVQRRLYNDYQVFVSLTEQLGRSNVPEAAMQEYEALLGKRSDVYDIFVNNDPSYLRRKSQVPPADSGIIETTRMRSLSRGRSRSRSRSRSTSLSPHAAHAEGMVEHRSRSRSRSGSLSLKPHVDFPQVDPNLWQTSGHLVTFGEMIGAMQYMVNKGTNEESASGMVSHTLVNHWMQRNVYPKSEKTVQKRIYKDYEDFALVIEEINRGYLSESLRRKYQLLIQRRDQVYDIFVGSDPEALKRTKMLEETYGVNMEAQHYRYLENQLSDIPRGHPQKLVSTPRNDRDYSIRTEQFEEKGYHLGP